MMYALRATTSIVFGGLYTTFVCGTVLHLVDIASPHSFYGMLSSLSTIALTLACPQKANAVHGAVVIAAAQLTYPSTMTWYVKKFWDWSEAHRHASGYDDNHVWYYDTFSMLTVACSASGLVVYHITRDTRIGLGVASTLLLMLHIVCHVDRLPPSSNVDLVVGILIAINLLAMLCFKRTATRRPRAGRTGAHRADQPAFYKVRPSEPRSIDDVVSAYWHASVALFLGMLLEFEDDMHVACQTVSAFASLLHGRGGLAEPRCPRRGVLLDQRHGRHGRLGGRPGCNVPTGVGIPIDERGGKGRREGVGGGERGWQGLSRKRALIQVCTGYEKHFQ